MAQVTAQMVKELRERTQAGMADCKSALVEAEGDMEKAVEIILKKGLAKSAKRAGAIAAEGEVCSLVAEDRKSGVLVEVNIQTDFAARNDKFREFARNVTAVALTAEAGTNLDEAKYPGTDKTIAQVRDELIAQIGEKITVRRWEKLVADEGFVADYVHLGGKIGVLVELAVAESLADKPEVKQLAEDLAMHIAAMNPLYLDRDKVPASAVEKQKEIFEAQLREEGKPEAAWPKILEGKVAKWYSDVCLLEQESVTESGTKVRAVVEKVAKAVGGTVAVRRFVRYERGEGIEKAADDFAAEVAKMAGG